MQRVSQWAKKIGVLLLGLTVTLLLLEGILRVFFHPRLPDRFFEPNDDFGWFHIPNRTGWETYPEFNILIEINSQGLRDQEYTYQKPQRVYRILILGDSFVEGLQVPQDDTFENVLERRLNDNDQAQGYEVINGGVSNFGTDNALLFYRYEGYRYQPDMVILAFFRNDVENNLAHPFSRLENGQLKIERPVRGWLTRHVEHTRGFLYDHSQVYRVGWVGYLIAKALIKGQASVIADHPDWLYARADSPNGEAGWALTRALIQQLKAESEAHGARFVFVILPEALQVTGDVPVTTPDEWDLDKPNRLLTQFLHEDGITYLDLLPHFRAHAQQTGQSLFYPYDGHLNTEGHRLAGDVLYQYLTEAGLLTTTRASR